MTVIALFNTPCTKEELRKRVVAVTDYQVVEDKDIIDGVTCEATRFFQKR